ncbi:uncharacterized protein LY89DRAFT_547074, partial [Mollisia scopiformis]
MNRFRTKKNKKENVDGIARASTDSDGPALPSIKSSMTFRRGKKSHEEPAKPELDLASALPSSDDFRTSLLMSGLSARFSMLREQDDPKSKIGKASDDSVLFPKRQSRMNDFGFQAHGLSDIAEVSSINGSIRPPFAFSRTDSYNTTEGYGTDDDSQHSGSIMNRAKPGESNNLFGGRQKISMGNRTLYDNDVSQSAFQKLREKERQQKEEAERREQEENEAASSRPSSPLFSGYNRNRETSSTTSSGGPSNTRTSTAATSFTSQRTPSLSGAHTPISPNIPTSGNIGLERSVTKTRRLYETGLDNHLHEQQFSAMNRIDTLTRQRTLGGHTPPSGPSPTFAAHPADRWGDRVQIASKGSMPNLRTASPATGPGMGTFDFGVRQQTIAETKPFGMTSPPLSPPMSEHGEQGVLTVQPNDRGKATALGAFSKPAQPYDETKYSQRQLQMQQGRETPPLRKHSPPAAFIPKQQQMTGRNRAESNATFASERSRSNSSAQRHFLPPDRIPEASKQVTVPEDEAIASGTFFSSGDDSSVTSPSEPEPIKSKLQPKPLDLSHLYHPDQQISLERPPESQHPAHRQRPFEEESRGKVPALPSSTLQPVKPVTPQEPADSPTLGPTSGLSGMVRQHLRTDSNTSSIYGGVPSVNFGSRFPLDPTDPMPQNDYGTKNNPWDDNDWEHTYYGESNADQDGAANFLNGNSFVPPPLSVRSPNLDNAGKSPIKPDWEKELEVHHTRDGSTETQKEQQDFKNELASRRRQITENLKSFHETESRSASPMPPVDLPKDPPMNAVLAKTNALGLLKKTSRGSLVVRQKEPGQSKAMKMLGIGNATMTSSPSPGKSTFGEAWKQEEEEMLRGVPTTPPTTKAFRQARRDAQRERERQVAMKHQQQRMAQDFQESEWPNPRVDNQPRYQGQNNDRAPPNIRTRHRTPSRERKPPPVAYAHRNGTTSSRESKDSTGTSRSDSRPQSRSSRERSGSDTSGGRSKSRNGRYKDDLARAMAEGTSSSAQGAYDELEPPPNRLLPRSPGTPNMMFQQSPIPSPMMGPDPRIRSNSRTGYFDPVQKTLTVQTGGDIMDIGKAPRPSPTAPFVVNPTPALIQPSPSGSGTSTPTSGVAQGISARKRSINKADISEPRFISSTSRVDTVNLPPGSSLKNGLEIHAPPIPPVNPRRRQTRGMFGLGRKDDYEEQYSIPAATQSSEEMSTFSADEDSKPKNKVGKLRKSSSEGGNLNARAREVARAAPSPAMPGSFPSGS